MKKLAVFFLLFGTTLLNAEKPKLYPPICERGFLYTETRGSSDVKNVISVKTKGIPDGTRLQLDVCAGEYSEEEERHVIREIMITVKDGVASEDLSLRCIQREDGRNVEVKLHFIVRYDSTGKYYGDKECYKRFLSKEEYGNMIRLEARSRDYDLYDKYVFKLIDFYIFPLYGCTFELTDGFETITKVYEKNPEGTLVFDKIPPGNWRLKMPADQSSLSDYMEKHPENPAPLKFEMNPSSSYFCISIEDMDMFGTGCIKNEVNWVFIGPYLGGHVIPISVKHIKDKNL